MGTKYEGKMLKTCATCGEKGTGLEDIWRAKEELERQWSEFGKDDEGQKWKEMGRAKNTD